MPVEVAVSGMRITVSIACTCNIITFTGGRWSLVTDSVKYLDTLLEKLSSWRYA